MQILKLIVAAAICLALLLAPLSIEVATDLQIFFLAVGQGDAIYIRTPDGVDVLIDSGPDATVLHELGRVMPVWDRHLDYVLLSHPDLDHLGGMLDIQERYDVGAFVWNKVEHGSQLYELFRTRVDAQSIELWKGDKLDLGCCVVFDVVWPDPASIKRYSSNNASLSGILRYNDVSIFFGGDIERPAENVISKTGEDVDLLKVSHHGSRSSTPESFLEVFKPEVAIIQSGKDNKFGHPHASVLDNLDRYGVQVFRTDELGTLKFVTDGIEYAITPY